MFFAHNKEGLWILFQQKEPCDWHGSTGDKNEWISLEIDAKVRNTNKPIWEIGSKNTMLYFPK